MPIYEGEGQQGTESNSNLDNRPHKRPFSATFEGVAGLLLIFATILAVSPTHRLLSYWIYFAALTFASFGAPLPKLCAWVTSLVGLGVVVILSHEAIIDTLASKTVSPTPAPSMPTDRPWLSVEVIPSGPIRFAEEGGVSIGLLMKVTNTGHSPANDVRLKCGLFFIPFDAWRDTIKRQQDVANGTSKGRPLGTGVLFPGATIEEDSNHISTLTQALESAAEEANRKAVIHSLGEVRALHEIMRPCLVGCITYKFGPPDQPFVGETGFVYEVMRHPVDNPKGRQVLFLGEDVPEELVVVEKTTFGGGGYAK